MTSFVYLDQNTLSDLRIRKLAESNDPVLVELRRMLEEQPLEVRLLYSSTHLDEIRQIKKNPFIQEHIDLLTELRATFIIPGSAELIAKPPTEIWENYLENERENERTGVTAVVAANDVVVRKMAGLPIEGELGELQKTLRESLVAMLSAGEESLQELADEGMLDEQSYAAIREHLGEQLRAVDEMPELVFPLDQEAGPRPLRNLDVLRTLSLEAMEPSMVIPALDNLFNAENAGFSWDQHFHNTTHNHIARCYTLMNWAGYFADDFTRIKKGKDRFRASSNDMMHVQQAAGATYLVSRDQAFLKKAEACYRYLEVVTEVMRPDQFLLAVTRYRG